MSVEQSFPKQQRLTGEIRIAQLFTKGKAFIAYPLRVVYLPDDKIDDVPARVVINVPKKRFKKAHDRNLLKRRMREAYRLRKHLVFDLLKDEAYTLNIGINYVSDDSLPFDKIDKKMGVAFDKLMAFLQKEKEDAQ